MLQATKRLAELEARYQRETFRDLTFEDALGIFTGLWNEARELNSEFGLDWEEDLEADLAVARAVNGLPPGP